MNILLLEDVPEDAARTRQLLTTEWPDCTLRLLTSPHEYRTALATLDYDLIIADFDTRGLNGRTSLWLAREACSTTPFIFLLRAATDDQVFNMVREGWWDYVLKDQLHRLRNVVPRVLRESDERRRRLQAEKELRQSEECFRSIFVSLADGVLLLDPSGVIISANPSAGRILGLSVIDLLGRPGINGWHLIREDLTPFPAEAFPAAAALRTGEPQPAVVFGIYQPDGGLVWVRGCAQPIVSSRAEGPTGIVMTLHDITETKHLQDQFQREHRLESLGLLAAGLAHDMYNFLAPVLIGAPLLLERSTNEADRKVLGTMESGARRGIQFVQQILQYTAGAGSEHRVVPMQPLVRDLANLLEASLPKSIQIVVDQDKALWSTKADPSQLNQVLLNLCINARDAMPKGGILRLLVKNHQLDLRTALALGAMPPGPYLRIEVTDNGPGIAPELHPRIWEPSFATKPSAKEAGLGLYTIRGIIQSHHGHIEVDSRVGIGTTFRIFLPAIADHPASPIQSGGSASPLPSEQGKGELVLVVDDEETIRDLVTTLLTEHGYRVLTVTDGMQAYSQLLRRGNEIRLLVTDLGMPELDGHGLALITRRKFPLIKILAISGKSSNAGLSADFLRHTDGFLHKPFKPSALFDAVQHLMHDGPVLQEAHHGD